MQKLKKFLEGATFAAAGGAMTAGVDLLHTIRVYTEIDWDHVIDVAATGAIAGVLAFWRSEVQLNKPSPTQDNAKNAG